METNTKGGNKEHWRNLSLRGKIRCDRCKPNRKDNMKRKPREDRYKNIDRRNAIKQTEWLTRMGMML